VEQLRINKDMGIITESTTNLTREGVESEKEARVLRLRASPRHGGAMGF